MSTLDTFYLQLESSWCLQIHLQLKKEALEINILGILLLFQERFQEQYKEYLIQRTINSFIQWSWWLIVWHFFVIFQLIMASVMFGPTIVFSFDKGYGAFGWLADTNILVYTLVVVAPIFGFVNNVAFNISYFFWPMEIIAGAVLTQPFFSQAAGVMMGQDWMPGFRTIFGLTAITIGSLASSYGSRLKAMQEVQKICKDDLTQSRLGMVSLQNITS